MLLQHYFHLIYNQDVQLIIFGASHSVKSAEKDAIPSLPPFIVTDSSFFRSAERGIIRQPKWKEGKSVTEGRGGEAKEEELATSDEGSPSQAL